MLFQSESLLVFPELLLLPPWELWGGTDTHGLNYQPTKRRVDRKYILLTHFLLLRCKIHKCKLINLYLMNLRKSKPTTLLSVVNMYFLYPHSNPSPPIPPSSISMLHETMFQKAIMPVIVRYYTTQPILYHNTILHYTAIQYTSLPWPVLHCSELQCSLLYYTVLRLTTIHCTALHCTTVGLVALSSNTLHFTAPHCTALHCTAPL